MSNLKKSKRDAIIGLVVTAIYFLIWFISVNIPAYVIGLLSLPLYFEISCIYLPISFITVITLYLIRKKDSKLINDDHHE